MTSDAIVVTCEHGGNRVPAEWAPLIPAHVLASHRGYDRGALGMARRLAKRLGAPLFSSTVTRLLVELNRSEHHRDLFSRYTRPLSADAKQRLLDAHYRPYRERVERHLAAAIRRGRPVLHLSMHTFTPVLRGERRAVDVGLLYDPARTRERRLGATWACQLTEDAPGLRVRRNAPYRGTADGFPTYLRKRFGNAYVGIELEVNQRFFDADGRPATEVVATIERSLARAAAR
ncbi:N-formylglutamate amidohydrolase [bacterium]|nr:N-formylglutamate amidohydrolase [bacterium]